MRKVCVQDIENISSCSFCVYPVVPIKLGKVIKYEAKQIMSNIYLETLNIERVKMTPNIIGGLRLHSVHLSKVKCLRAMNIIIKCLFFCSFSLNRRKLGSGQHERPTAKPFPRLP